MASPYGGVDLSTIPAANPPPGVVPNFVNPPSQAELPKIFIYVTLPLMVVFLGLRIYTRIKYTRLGLDDVIDHPAGPHMWDIPLSKVTVDYAQFTVVLANMYFVAALFIKTSILTLYSRIFRPSDLINLLIWICMVLVVLFYVISIIVFTASCVPRWEDYKTGGWLSPIYAERCYNTDGRVTIAAGAVGTFIDVYILVLPAVFLSRLNTTTRRKAGLLAIFAVGTAALAFSIAGTYYRSKIVSSENQDLSWNTMPIYATNVGEINVGIMSSCMPVIFVLFRSFTTWSVSWVSRLRSVTSRARKQNHSAESGDIQLLHYNNMDESSLPTPPKGALTGLRSFMRNFNRTNPAKTQLTNMSLTYASADYDYHAQLKQQASNQHKPSTGGGS
ncbi:hypothetical protein F5Y07DRAFT_407642 [Xylaria sp. FL0933]|nr:hypothetical protein F5Y07DRAFT_407642 [Xylaria sp. FL0933]